MTDRNTISQIIESLFEDWIDENINVHPLAVEYMRILEADALALLKEQETVEPISPTDESDLWRCGNCNHQLFRCTHQRFCEECGRKIGWNDM